MDHFWEFIWLRPGLDASGAEWRACVGDALWRGLRERLFTGQGIAATCRSTADDRSLHVVLTANGRRLVCETTGTIEAENVPEEDIRRYRIDASAMRDMLAEVLGIITEPGVARGVPRAFPLGDWRPLDAVTVPAFLMFPPTTKLLSSEIQRLLLEITGGFLLFVPQRPQLDARLRDQLERRQAAVIPIPDVVAWNGTQFCAAPGWDTYRNAYCTRHLSDRMVPAEPAYQFAKKGMWAIRFAGKETFLEGELKGAAFIHHLIRHQGKHNHVIRLMADVAGAVRTKIVAAAESLETDSAAADVAADEQTIKECQARYDSLVTERKHAEEDHISEIDTEIAKIAAYLSSTLGLGKKSRKIGDEVAAARRRIARVINIAIDKIEKSDAELATHLRNSIKTHTEMVYEPDREVDWVLM